MAESMAAEDDVVKNGDFGEISGQCIHGFSHRTLINKVKSSNELRSHS